MKPELMIANVVWTGIGLVVAWATYRLAIFPLLRDSLRFKLFSVRREMFLLVKRGELERNDPAYVWLRSFINAAIRYADGISITRSLIGLLTHAHLGRERSVRIEVAIDALAEPARSEMVAFRRRAQEAILIYSLATSVVGWALLISAVTIVALMDISSVLKRHLAGWWNRAQETLRKRAEDQTQCRRSLEEDEESAEGVLAAA